MGPLNFCTTCNAELTKAVRIVEFHKKDKLQNIDLEELYTISEEHLLNNTLFGLFNKLELGLCCRTMISSHLNITSQIYN